VQDILNTLKKEVGSNLKVVEPVAKFTAINVGGPADFFYEARSKEDIIRSVDAARKIRIPFIVIGAGSSVLFSDSGFHGLVIRNVFDGIKEFPAESPASIIIEVGSGISLAKLVRFCAEKNYSGLEKVAGMAGTVGGALVVNTANLSDNVDFLEIVDVIGKTKQVPRNECGFKKGTSRFNGREEIILTARFLLLKSDQDQITRKLNKAIEEGMTVPKEPHVLRLFADDEGQPPERLIEALGLIDAQVGGAVLVTENPNYLRNTGSATSENVLELAKIIKGKIKEKYYSELKEDFVYVGS